MKKILSIFILLTAFILLAQAKDGYKITIKIDGLENTDVIFGYRYGDKQYVKDTFTTDNKGVVTIESKDENLDPGVYMLVFPTMNNNFIEFIVNEQIISLETSKNNLIDKMKVITSTENKMFFDDAVYMNTKRKEAESIKDKQKVLDKSSDEYKGLQSQLENMDKEMKAYRSREIAAHPNLLYSKMLKALTEVDIPDGPKNDTTFQYRYFKTHYWDNYDFNEPGLLRCPVYTNLLNRYIDQVIPQIPDSLNKACDYVLEHSMNNPDLFQYTLVTLLNKYAKSNIMGQDAVYVHLVLDYYAKGYATWQDSAGLASIVERAMKIEPLLIGKTAPNLNLYDTLLANRYELYKVEAPYTLLIFWDEDCGHCKKELPVVVKEYNEKLKAMGVKVYTVCTAPYEEIEKWKKFIFDNGMQEWINTGDPYNRVYPNFRTLYDINSTPVLYLLDKDKKIIAKRMAPDQIGDFLEKYEEFELKKKMN